MSKRKIYALISELVTLIPILICFYYSLKILSYKNFSISLIDFYEKSLNKEIIGITDIQLEKYKCQENYEEMKLGEYTLKNGCDCRNIKNNPETNSNSLNEFYENFCTKKMLDLGCKNINGVKSFPIHKYLNYKFCIQKERYGSYKELLKRIEINKENFTIQCNSGYKKCGRIDKNSNILCLKSNATCPINSIKLLNSNRNPYFDNNYYYESREFFENFKILYFTNNKIEYPIIYNLTIIIPETIIPLEQLPIYETKKINFLDYLEKYKLIKDNEKLYEILLKNFDNSLMELGELNAELYFYTIDSDLISLSNEELKEVINVLNMSEQYKNTISTAKKCNVIISFIVIFSFIINLLIGFINIYFSKELRKIIKLDYYYYYFLERFIIISLFVLSIILARVSYLQLNDFHIFNKFGLFNKIENDVKLSLIYILKIRKSLLLSILSFILQFVIYLINKDNLNTNVIQIKIKPTSINNYDNYSINDNSFLFSRDDARSRTRTNLDYRENDEFYFDYNKKNI